MMTDIYKIGEYTILIERDEDDDDFWYYHNVILPSGEQHMLDTCRNINDKDIAAFISFYEVHGRFPTRKDHPTNKVGGLNAQRILEIK
jgi:hypothetical protein